MTTEQKLDRLKELVFATDNTHCFIERDRFLSLHGEQDYDRSTTHFYADVLSGLLDSVSTPVDTADIIVGRTVEGPVEKGIASPCRILSSMGHMQLRYEKLLKFGLKGILEKINRTAAEKGDEQSRIYAENAGIVINAIRKFALRYSEAAEKAGLSRAAQTLKKVPYEGAYDFFSALQSIWMIHFIASCYVGSRDYAFGRFDEYMLPYYEKSLTNGETREQLTGQLAGLFMKTNEICGRTSWNYAPKPILSVSSKQYVNIGGEHVNELSSVVLDAAVLCDMAQPEITVLLHKDSDEAFKRRVFTAMAKLTDSLQVYNYDLIKQNLVSRGIDEKIASEFTFSACCTFDLNSNTVREEYYIPTVQLFCETLNKKDYTGVSEIAQAYKTAVSEFMKGIYPKSAPVLNTEENCRTFILDGILIGDCAECCRYPFEGGVKYHAYNAFFPGIATIGDSLAAIDRIVFKEKRMSYSDFMSIVNSDYEGNEELRREIEGFTRFGNDSPADDYTAMAANALADAADTVELSENSYIIGGFYSLHNDNVWADSIPATPDSRKAGKPFSENQSPSYSADKNGITALLKSVARLPFKRVMSGGLNLTFSQNVTPETLMALTKTYFELSGLHIGITVLDRETLADAIKHPENHRALTVRLYGFSEYFINLPCWQQQAVLNRTAY